MSRSEGEIEKSDVNSLTALAGLRSVIEAHLYYEELQAGLDNILITGDNVEEMWCLVDWHRYLLKSWIEAKKQGHCGPEEKWFHMTDTWLNIIDAMVDLIFNYALPSQHHQRSILQEREFGESTGELNFRNMLRRSHGKRSPLTAKDQTLLDSIINQRYSWTDSPRMHEKPFRKLVTGIRRNINDTVPEEKLQLQRQCGIESSDFQSFIEEIEEKTKELVSLLPEKEQEELHLAAERACRTALINCPIIDVKLRYIRFIERLRNWLPSNPSTRSNLDATYRRAVQGAFECGIASRRPAELFTTKDLQDIIALGADIRGVVRGRDDCSLWAAAGSPCSIDLFKALVDAGAPYTTECNRNESPLHAAAKNDNINILAFLLSKNHSFQIDVNYADWGGMTALHAAAQGCRRRAVDLLLQHSDIDANAQDVSGNTPLLLAVRAPTGSKDKYAVVRNFLKNKRVDAHCKSTQGVGALHYAARFKDATLPIILRHVKSINATALDGSTPLHFAVSANAPTNVSLLLKNGADPTVIGGFGIASQLESYKRYVAPDVSDGFGTPLQLACHERHLGPMRVLLSIPQSLDKQWPVYGPTIDYDTREGISVSPVTLILQRLKCAHGKQIGHIHRALKLVLGAEPDPELRDCNGRSVLSVLSLSIEKWHKHIFLDVLRAGADINSQDNNGDSPLHLLLSENRSPHVEELFKFLLKWGADPDLTNKQGKTAIAANPTHPRIHPLAAIVREHKAKVAATRAKNVKARGSRR